MYKIGIFTGIKVHIHLLCTLKELLQAVLPLKISYRQNCKLDAQQCYLMVKEDPKIEYLKRLKKTLDEIHLEYSYILIKT